jgi:hypothetical protein
MGKLKTDLRLQAEKICTENPTFSIHKLSKLLHSKNPDKTFDRVRYIVRVVRGKAGNNNRKYIADTSLFTPLAYNHNYIETKDSEQYKLASKKKLRKSKYYIITWAQNNTPVNKEFLNNIKTYASFLDAEIHVVLGRYKNPTSVFTDSKEEHWDNDILPYADANKQHIHKNLELLSDIKIQPTAINPLTGMEGVSGLCSCIFGHPKMQFKVIAALEGYEPKMMFTTGAVTKSNYTDSRAGKKGEFHHVFGFVIVEIKDNETFYIRQVTALKNGSFTDLIYNVNNSAVNKIDKIDIAVLGDIHVGDDCKLVNNQQRRWLDKLRPKYTMIHDVFNGHSISHHESKDPIKQFERENNNSNSLQKELEDMFKWIKSMLKYNPVFVSSNHNDWIDRYIKEMDWKRNIKNALVYMKCADIALTGKSPKGLIAYFIEQEFNKRVKCLGRNDSFTHSQWELAQHLDIGTNGSRGSLAQFRRLSTKMIGGHSHTPSRTDGVLYVGTSTKLRVGYNVGASNWMNCDVIIHKDKKAQHIIYLGKDKNFTTFKL